MIQVTHFGCCTLNPRRTLTPTSMSRHQYNGGGIECACHAGYLNDQLVELLCFFRWDLDEIRYLFLRILTNIGVTPVGLTLDTSNMSIIMKLWYSYASTVATSIGHHAWHVWLSPDILLNLNVHLTSWKINKATFRAQNTFWLLQNKIYHWLTFRSIKTKSRSAFLPVQLAASTP